METNQNETQKIKVVKKYANRKFYDTETSQYVTLREIQDAVKTGREVIVIENSSKRDITDKTLFAALIETAEETKVLSRSEIVALIRKSQFGTPSETV